MFAFDDAFVLGVLSSSAHIAYSLSAGSWLAVWYATASVITFFVYAIDKSAAKQRAWRTPERTLHLLALAGGWPGALLAQQFLRHKTSKARFKVTFWATVVLNLAGFVWFFTPTGRVTLNL